jgi:TP901 family phage tail tape measure protein
VGLEAFTVMAILDAQDKASSIFERAAAVISDFTDTMARAAGIADEAGAAIDDSLLKTASGADALSLANDRVSGSQAKLTLATQEQAAAEQNLMDTRASGLGGDEALAAATDQLAAADTAAAAAATELAAAQERQAAVAEAAAGTNEEAAATTKSASSTAYLGIAAAFAAAGYLAVKAATDFQSSSTHLVTDAGETAGALKTVQNGLIDMAAQVGFSANDLSTAMYHVESAGFHVAQGGLDVMRVAAEGAKVGNANLDTTTKTLAGTMVAYGAGAGDAAKIMNELIATTAAGDLRMQDLTTSLGAVVPIAASAKISLAEVGGAIATMTSQNMTAQQATQNLGHLITSLQKPTSIMTDEAQQLGLNMNDVSNNLGKNGLSGTLSILVDAIGKNTKGGQVFIDTLQQSTNAAANAKTMLSQMPGPIKDLADKLQSGAIGVTDYNKAIGALDPTQYKMGKQFLTLNEGMGSFNKLVSANTPVSQTFNAALSKLTGGQVGLRTALMLSADGGLYFNNSVAAIQESADKSAGKVDNWNTIQKTFAQQMSEAKAGVEALGVKIGMVLLPYVQKAAGYFVDAAKWMSNNAVAAKALAAIIAGVLVGAIIALGTAAAVAAGPEILIATVIIGLGYAVMYAYQHFKIFRTVVDDVGKFMMTNFKVAWFAAGAIIDWFRTDILPKVVAGIKDVISWFDSHKEDFKDAWDTLVKEVEKLVHWFDDNVLKWLKARLDEFSTWWKQHGTEIEDIWKVAWGIIATILVIAWNLVILPTLKDILAVWKIVWGAVVDVLKLAWGLISDAVTIGIHFVENILAIVLDLITGHWGQAWNDMGKLLSDAWHDIIKFITDAVSNFGTLLYDAGANLIKGLISGIKSAVGGITSTISGVASTISSFFPHSPAKTGPLSGSGGMDIAGANVGKMLASGMNSSSGLVAAASSSLARSAQANLLNPLSAGGGLSALSAGGGAGASSGSVVFDLRGSQVMGDQAMDQLVNKLGRRVATQILPSGGVRIRT